MTALLNHLPLLLAQAADSDTPTPDGSSVEYHLGTGGVIALVIFGLLGFVLTIVTIAAVWKVFTKAGEPGWAVLIPFYNFYVMCNIARKPNWWLIFIPLVGAIYALIVVFALAEQFGKGAGFALGLIFLPFIFYPILGFGSAQYRGTPPLPASAGAALA